MSWVMFDVEASGPCPTRGSMMGLGAVVVREPLEEAPQFLVWIAPPYEDVCWREMVVKSSLSPPEYRRFQVIGNYDFCPPVAAMNAFVEWVKKSCVENFCFVSDNPGFDWAFLNDYLHRFGPVTFGHSCQSLGSLYKGLTGSVKKNFKYLRKTLHTHNPLDDAMGNAEALIHMVNKMGLKMDLK